MKANVFVFWLYIMSINVTKFVKTADLHKWEKFKTEFKKHYATPKEDKRRKKIFDETMHMITEHNKKYKKGEVTYGMGMNQFGDMTEEEIEGNNCPTCATITLDNDFDEPPTSHKGGFKFRKPEILTSLPPGSGTAPEFKNWTNDGAVTPVKNQLRCGSCWAFATIGAIESHNFIHTGQLVALSEQNLMDCMGEHQGTPDKNPCRGASPYNAFQYVHDNQGIATEESYPYTAKKGLCRYKDATKGATIVDYKQLEPRDEELMKSYIGLIGPVYASIKMERGFRMQKNGIYISSTCNNSIRHHAVLVVGYGTENNIPYWLVKNSWGIKAGHYGYYKIRRGTNECGISQKNIYPIF